MIISQNEMLKIEHAVEVVKVFNYFNRREISPMAASIMIEGFQNFHAFLNQIDLAADLRLDVAADLRAEGYEAGWLACRVKAAEAAEAVIEDLQFEAEERNLWP